MRKRRRKRRRNSSTLNNTYCLRSILYGDKSTVRKMHPGYVRLVHFWTFCSDAKCFTSLSHTRRLAIHIKSDGTNWNPFISRYFRDKNINCNCGTVFQNETFHNASYCTMRSILLPSKMFFMIHLRMKNIVELTFKRDVNKLKCFYIIGCP